MKTIYIFLLFLFIDTSYSADYDGHYFAGGSLVSSMSINGSERTGASGGDIIFGHREDRNIFSVKASKRMYKRNSSIIANADSETAEIDSYEVGFNYKRIIGTSGESWDFLILLGVGVGSGEVSYKKDSEQIKQKSDLNYRYGEIGLEANYKVSESWGVTLGLQRNYLNYKKPNGMNDFSSEKSMNQGEASFQVGVQIFF